nr:integrase, catalytic region, zinc finger, CCHC-type, peptidase aspartic, catalytic [Tanacetum cinerariifolium]
MTTLAEHIIVAGADNHPPMLEKLLYDSWASRIRLFIKGKKHGRMMLDSIDNGPLVYPTVEENRQSRLKKYSELTEAQQLQDDCDVQATNIILHGLPPDVHALLYAYLSQHERHANEVRISRERYPNSLAFIAKSLTLYNPSQSPQHSGYSMYPPPQQFTPVYETPIHQQHHHTAVNPFNSQQHLVSPLPFISPSLTPQSQAEFPQLDSTSRFPPSNNQIRTSSNPKNQATIQDGRVTVQQVQGRQHQSYAGIGNKGIATTSKGNIIVGPQRVVKCYKCQGEGHMARQYPGMSEAPVAHQAIPQNSAFQTGDSDAYDSDCDELSSAKAVLMANLSSCDPEVLSEVPYSNSYSNDMINQDVQEMQYSKQTHVDDFKDNEIHSDLNAQLQEKVFAITALKNELRKIKGKNVVNTVVSKPNATLAPRMFKLDIEPIFARLKNNRDAHEVYIDKTIEYANTLRGFVEGARTQYPSKPLLESACMFTKHVQELLVYASQTCPNSPEPRVKPTTNASGSKSSGNTKNNRITRPPQPTHLWGSNATDVPSSSSLINDRLSKSSFGIWTLNVQNMTGNCSQLMNSLVNLWVLFDSETAKLQRSRGMVTISREDVDLLSGSRDTNLYTVSLVDMLKTSLICLLSKASNTKRWLWHRRLSHLNFGTLNKLAKDGLARVPVVVAPRAVKIADSLVSTSIDQDAPSSSITSTQD